MAKRFPEILTTGQAAKRANVHIDTLRDWIKSNPDLVAYSTPRGYLLDAARFEKFLKSHQRQNVERQRIWIDQYVGVRKEYPIAEWMHRIEGGATLSEIGQSIGVTKCRVSQVLASRGIRLR